MHLCPPEPNPGEKISASWMRNLIRYVRGLQPISGPGIKLAQGPNGTVYTADPAAFKPQTLPQCFDIKSADASSDSLTLTNCYFTIGSKVFMPGSGDMVCAEYKNKIVALEVTMDGLNYFTLMSFSSFSELNNVAEDLNAYLQPLYWFTANGDVKVDLRNIPTLNAWEMSR